MYPRFVFLACLCWLALLTRQAQCGEPTTVKTHEALQRNGPARTDAYGDPLPDGVVARLGTARLTLVGKTSVLKFSPDGRRLAVYDTAEQLRVWDVSSGKELLRLKGLPFRGSGSLAFSPDGKALAMGCGDQTVRVWDAATGKELHRLGSPMGQVMSLCFSRDGQRLFAGGYDSPVLCWDLAGGGNPRKIGAPLSSRFMALARDGKTVTTGSYDKRDGGKWTFARWDTDSGKELGRHALTLSAKWTGELSPEGGILARPEEDGKSITLLDPLTGRELSRVQGSDYPANIIFSADAAVMTCRSKDGIVHVWDTATGKVRARFAAFLKARLKGDKLPDERRIARLIADLDADTFATREKASAELEKLGIRAQSALRRALQGQASAELRSRAKHLLERLGSSPDPELIRLRVVEALEANGSPEARQVLTELAEESADTPLKQEAKASLARLRSRRVQQ